MRGLLWLCGWCWWFVVCGTSANAGHTFPRWIGAGGQSRRVFGGSTRTAAARCPAAEAAAAALLDGRGAARCSAAALAARWLLTAAHCVSPRVRYATFRAQAAPEQHRGDWIVVEAMYRHPEYRVVQQAVGRGADVPLLHHDVGLVRTAPSPSPSPSSVPTPLSPRSLQDALHALRRYDPTQLLGEEVQVCGFGVSERWGAGERLGATALQLCACERGEWRHCVCAAAPPDDPRGVCAGDSGGPVFYKGQQIGVTSMGPLECSAAAAAAAAAGGATSVLTTLYRYVDVLNATVLGAEGREEGSAGVGGPVLPMTMVTPHSAATGSPPPLLATLGLALFFRECF